MEHHDAIYLKFEQIQSQIDRVFAQTGERTSGHEAILALYEEGQYLNAASNSALVFELMEKDDEEFLKRKGELYLVVGVSLLGKKLPEFDENIPVCLTRRFTNEASPFVSYSHFEITYIFKGSFSFEFESEKRIVREGDVLIVSPHAKHRFTELSSDAFYVQVLANYKTFHSTFIGLLNINNILSNFFKSILINQERRNFLQISTGDSSTIRSVAKKMYLEQYTFDSYSPQCTHNWLQLFFSYVLRSYNETYQFATNATGIDFAPILRYLEKNYLTTTLKKLAEEFHYSSCYMSILIKQVTGKTYSELIRDLKINDAKDYLLHSDKTIEMIASVSGYNSADHFSRTFKAVTGISPQQYRTIGKSNGECFNSQETLGLV